MTRIDMGKRYLSATSHWSKSFEIEEVGSGGDHAPMRLRQQRKPANQNGNQRFGSIFKIASVAGCQSLTSILL